MNGWRREGRNKVMIVCDLIQLFYNKKWLQFKRREISWPGTMYTNIISNENKATSKLCSHYLCLGEYTCPLMHFTSKKHNTFTTWRLHFCLGSWYYLALFFKYQVSWWSHGRILCSDCHHPGLIPRQRATPVTKELTLSGGPKPG